MPADAIGASTMHNDLNTMKNLKNNPQRSKELYDLCSGEENERDKEIPFGIIDASLIQKICETNRYGTSENGKLDSCLFILTSYFNHACLANAFRYDYGDVMIVYASDDIKKGEEICISYLDPLYGFLDRQNKLSGWKFTCRCKLCEIESKDPNCLKRDETRKEYNKYEKGASPKEIIAKGEPLLKKIRESYTNRNEFKYVLADNLISLSLAYSHLENISKSIECSEEVLTLMDNPLQYIMRMGDIYMNLAICYEIKGDMKKGAKMVEKAMELRFCKEMDHFKLLYPDFIVSSHLR
uniref:SET domain-containing protein n=1 Tax=Panagrolaimus sp. PS1159 TaxID=55785 RepID=A0AC35GU03_9BILA